MLRTGEEGIPNIDVHLDEGDGTCPEKKCPLNEMIENIPELVIHIGPRGQRVRNFPARSNDVGSNALELKSAFKITCSLSDDTHLLVEKRCVAGVMKAM